MIVTSPERHKRRTYLDTDQMPEGKLSSDAHEEGLVGLLDHVRGGLNEHEAQAEVNRTMDDLILGLRSLRGECQPERWRDMVDLCREHPVCQLLHNDPFTHRAYSKPRGYPGDAKLLDYIYGCEERWPAPEATAIGRRVWNYTTAAPAPEGVRARRGFVADLIDRLAQQIREPHVLSIAAGHLREASLSSAVKRGKVGRMVALDADPESLREVTRCYGCFGVETVPASIRRLLGKRCDVGAFDLVYSTGLFDYLQQPLGRRLVSRMFGMLRSQGRLVVANFLPGVRDVGYMEAYMDWFLVYRTRRDMIDLTMEIPEDQIQEITLFTEENQNIIFLEVIRS